jgi:hypothetical protein
MAFSGAGFSLWILDLARTHPSKLKPALQKRVGANLTMRAKKKVPVTEIAIPETQQEEM